MPRKEKLSKEERSQIAKDRWAKIRAARKQEDDKTFALIHASGELESARADLSIVSAPPIVEQDTVQQVPESIPQFSSVAPIGPVAPPVELPAPQLALVKAPKPKRYQGPKEFSVALKAAENRLAKAITERSDIGKELAILQAKQWYLEKTEIPSLMGIINALKGSGNYAPPTPFDFSGGVPNAQAFQAPIDPQAALMAAMAAPPVSRASGGAVQFSPDVVGSLEGPDDDDPDRFITGPHAGGGWIGA